MEGAKESERKRRKLKVLGKLPDAPGVYFFLGRSKKILYIGRATSLRSRVRSYFDGRLLETRGPWLAKMLPEVRTVDFKKTESVLEAIFLEGDLIRKFQPRFNTDEKDDKSYNCIVITKEPFPRVMLARKRDLDFSSLELRASGLALREAFGPFPHGLQLREAMKLLRRIFPWRDDKCVQCLNSGKAQPYLRKVEPCRPCFNRQIGLCPGVCTGEISSEEYEKHIRKLSLFLSGKRAQAVRELQREMKAAARAQEFEQAGELKRQLFALKHIQDVALMKRTSGEHSGAEGYRIEAYDLSHFGGKEIVGAMTVVENGRAVPAEHRLFKIRGIQNAHETEGLKEVLRRRFNHPEWKFPQLIVVDGNEIQKGAAEKMLASLGQAIPIVAVVKDEKHRPREVLGDQALARKYRVDVLLANSEAHRFVLKLQRKRRSY